MSTDDWISVTDEESKIAEELAFKAACEQFECINDDSLVTEIHKSIFLAFIAVKKVIDKFNDDFKELHKGNENIGFYYVDEDQIVASAFSLVVIHGTSYEPGEYPAYSLRGYQIASLAHAYAALASQAQAEYFICGEANVGGDTAKYLLERLKPETSNNGG